jgi:RND family efflux transporter MFP subunit
MKRALGFFIILAALGVFGYFWWESVSTPPEAAETITPPVTVAAPQEETLRRELALSGTIEADSSVTVLPKVSGEIESLRVESGDAVEKGTVVATINDERYAPRHAEAEAALAAARSSFQRAERLFDAGSATEQEFEQARAQFESAQAQERLAELQLQYTDIRAPIGGTVLSTRVSEGDMVSQETPVARIATTDALVVTVDVAEQYYTQVSRRNIFRVELEVPAAEQERRLPAQIQSVAPYVSAATKTFELTARLEEHPDTVRPGMYADVYVVLAQRETPAIPVEALVGGSTVWYVDEQNQARPLRLTDPFVTEAYVAIPQEHAEKSFIVEGQHFLRDGQGVRRIQAEQSE